MNFRIVSFVLLVCVCSLAPTCLKAATLLPTLGNVLDGGAFDAQEDYVLAAIKGQADLSTGGILSVNDSIRGVLSFSGVGSSVATSAGSLGTPGYAALVFSANVLSSNSFGAISFGNLTAKGNLGTLLSNVSGVAPGTGAFAALLTSETVNFAISNLASINSSNVNLEGLFDLAIAPEYTTSLTGSGPAAVLNVNFQAALNAQPGSLPTGLGFFDVDGVDLQFTNHGDIGNLTVLAGNSSGVDKALGGNNLLRVNPVPEPASMLTLLGCVTGACAMGRRRRKASKAA